MKLFLWAPALALLVLLAVTGDWLLASSHTTTQQKNAQLALLKQLAGAVKAEPTQTAELLTLALELCRCQQIRLQQRDGKVLALAGSVLERPQVMADGWSQAGGLHSLAVSVRADTQLVALSVVPGILPRWTQLLAWLAAMVLFGCVIRQARREQLQQHQLTEQVQRLTGEPATALTTFSDQIQQLNIIAVEMLQRRQQEQELRQQLARLTEQLTQQQTEAVQQTDKLQHQLVRSSHQLSCWQTLAQQSQWLQSQQLSQFVKALVQLQGQPSDELPVAIPSFAKWFAQQFVQQQAAMPVGNTLLPDEDPTVCRSLVEVAYQPLANLLQTLFELIRPYNEGPETLLGYRILDEAQPYLALTLQYNGKVLPARVRQIIEQGPVSAPDWPELLAEMVFTLMQQLSASWQLQQLPDVGSRFVLHIPLRLQAKADKKLCQNMLVYDSRECRQGLWRHSLRAVAEQLLVVSSFEQLTATLQSRLIDMVVVHIREEQLSAVQLQQLKQLAHRYPLTVFASSQPDDVLQQLQSFGRFYASPVLLGAMCDQPVPDHRLASQQLLVVDDNQTNLSFIRAMLAGLGVGIDYATSGQDAIRYASHSRYQLILMDIQLPDLAGTEVTKQIRQLRHHQQTQILAFTAHALPDEVASFKLAGMDDVLFKPLDERKIAHILQQLRPVRETT